MQSLIGVKKVQSQRFLENGMRIPVTLIDVKDNWVMSVKTTERDHYQAVQLGYGIKKNANKALLGHAKGAKRGEAPKFLKEVRITDDSPLPEIGTSLNPQEVFQPGDLVDVTGISKGKGFAGGVKRYGFRGGPKTHGQSDRHRAPGSIGQGTTPGRVYKGKRMAGNMGNDTVTVRGLRIIDITDDGVLVIKGLVPGVINGLIKIDKAGTDKKFVPLYRDPEVVAAEQAAAEAVSESADGQTSPSGDAQGKSGEVSSSESASLSGNQPTEVKEEAESGEGSVSDSPQESSPTVTEENLKEEVKGDEDGSK